MHELGLCRCEDAPTEIPFEPAPVSDSPTGALPVPVLEHELVTVLHGDSLRLLEVVAPNSIDAIVTDPPAGIAFQGEGWDDYRRAANANDAGRDNAFGRLSRSGPEYGRDEQGFIEAMTPIFAAACAALKPGGHGVFWAIPRTSDWTIRALRAAGFEIRDQIHDLLAGDELLLAFLDSLDDEQRLAFTRLLESQASPILYWLYGQGMPKSGAHLKPGAEHWVLVRKPCEGSAKSNLRKHGTGLLNIEEARIDGAPRTTHADGNRQGTSPHPMSWGQETRHTTPGAAGRWPANLTLAHAPGCELVGTSTEDRPLRVPDGEVADATYRGGRPSSKGAGTEPVARDVYRCVEGCPVAALDAQAGIRRSGGLAAGTPRGVNSVYGKSLKGAEASTDFAASKGSAARFFFCAKPAKSEKLAGIPADAPRHPTVKPLALMRWLVRLVTPPGGVVLDPFAGSGTTLLAALEEGRQSIGIERESKYLPALLGRVRFALNRAA
jgi:DNA modification methylase